jgi:hypothetical protein
VALVEWRKEREEENQDVVTVRNVAKPASPRQELVIGVNIRREEERADEKNE